MRRSKQARTHCLRTALSLLLSLAMVLQGVPCVPGLGIDKLSATELSEETGPVTTPQAADDEIAGDKAEGDKDVGSDDAATDDVVADGATADDETTDEVATDEAASDGATADDVATGDAATDDATAADAATDDAVTDDATEDDEGTEDAQVEVPAQSEDALSDENERVLQVQSDPAIAAESNRSTVATATSFTIRGLRGSASRTATVKYVDQFGKALSGTVTGQMVLTYDTTNPGVPNDTNSYDLYELKDKLADNYKDDYEFSRVYLALRNDQKDFRYLFVSTDRDIHGSGQTYTRLYTYMNNVKDDTKAGGVYNSMWYTLPGSGDSATNTVFAVYNHVREVAFSAVDSENGPVAGAKFALYSDEICYTEFEYKDRSESATDESDEVPVTATSGADGSVSFGKIPYGTYYMRETTVPKGFKDTGSTYKVVVGDTVQLYKATAEGYTQISAVGHEWSDGSIILNGLTSMTVEKKWDGDTNGSNHSNRSNFKVTVEVYSKDVVNGREVLTEADGSPFELNSGNTWKKELTGLNPKLSYVVTETSVKETTAEGDVNRTSDWIPTIAPDDTEPVPHYYRASAFKKGSEYVLALGNDEALSGTGGELGISSLSASTDAVTGTVTDDMLWRVERINNDGVITLRNVSDGKYLDFVASTWCETEVQPKFVRHTNSGGDINLYYRENYNAANPFYLTISGDTISSSSSAPSPALFEIYQKIDVRSVNVTVTNKPTTYSVKMRNLRYDNSAVPPAGMQFAVYTESEYEKYEAGQTASAYPRADNLLAGDDGYLVQNGENVIDLPAGTYYLVQKGELEGYRSYSPIRFVVTRGGMLRARQDLPNFEYTTETSGDTSYLVLQNPCFKLQTVTVKKTLIDNYDTSTGRQFDFTAKLVDPNENKAIVGWNIGSEQVTDAQGEITFSLGDGGSKDFVVPVGASLLVMETTQGYVTKVAEGDEGTAVAVRGSSYEEKVADANILVTFTNLRAVAKIAVDDTEEPFESIAAALEYARDKLSGQPVTIQMLLGTYDMTADDAAAATLGAGEDVTFSTAQPSGSSYSGTFPYLGEAGTAAVIRRAADNTAGSLFTVNNASAKLALQGVVLDGNSSAVIPIGNGGLVNVAAGTFAADEQTILRNSSVSGNGGALYVAEDAQATLAGTTFTNNAVTQQGQQGADVYLEAGSKALLSGGVCIASTPTGVGALYLAQGANGTEIEVAGDLTRGASVYVWAEESGQDGGNMTGDEQFAITSQTSATSVSGLERIISQRAGQEVTAAPGKDDQVVWTILSAARVSLEVKGEFADKRKEFDVTLTVPENTPQIAAIVNGQEQVFKAGENTFKLANNQAVVLKDARKFDTYVFQQTSEQVSSSIDINMEDGLYDAEVRSVTGDAVGEATLVLDTDDARKFTLSNIQGTTDEPASVLITNHLGENELPMTGVSDNARVWIGVVVVCACLIAFHWLRRLRV